MFALILLHLHARVKKKVEKQNGFLLTRLDK